MNGQVHANVSVDNPSLPEDVIIPSIPPLPIVPSDNKYNNETSMIVSDIEDDATIEPSSDLSWTEYLELLKQFHTTYDHSNVPSDYSPDKNLWRWTNLQRRHYRDDLLKQTEISRLQSINFIFSSRNNSGRLDVSVEGSMRKILPCGELAKICKHDGCTKYAQIGGLCVGHGAKRRICKHDGCTSKAKQGGLCVKHGAVVKKNICKHDGCTKYAQKGGLCIGHGAKRTICKHDGCTSKAQQGGVCIKHGAVVKKYICKHDGCTSFGRMGGFCIKHADRKPKI